MFINFFFQKTVIVRGVGVVSRGVAAASKVFCLKLKITELIMNKKHATFL